MLQDWLGSHPQNVSWLSPEIQNKLLHLLSLEVVSHTADDLRGSCFSILCDEVSDHSNSELMNIIVRYVTAFGFIREAVVGLIKAGSTAAANLCSVVDARLEELRLSVNDIVGQCYDGASNMSGHTSGLQARLKDLSIRKPIFVHCCAHVFNLVLLDICKQVSTCARTFKLLHSVYVVVEGSPKHHGEYMTLIADLGLDDGLKVLQSLAATRWAARCVNLKIVERCFVSDPEVLETADRCYIKWFTEVSQLPRLRIWIAVPQAVL